jgi:ribosomal protein S2
MHLLYISIIQLNNYKIFIGHSILNSILLSSWLIFNLRGKTTLLNLFNTIKMLKLSYKLIKHIVIVGLPIWFINFDLTKEKIIIQNASKAGEFYSTRKWIRGLISNFYGITKAFRKYLIKKEFFEMNKVKDIYSKWFLTRFTWPRIIFISNIKNAYIISKEASSIKVPIIALLDTNMKTHLYNIPIPSNDDSSDSIGFMNNIISFYIISSKYKNVLIWYFFNRNITRYQTLVNWFNQLKIKIKNKINLRKIKIFNFLNYYIDTKKGLNLFFSRSYNFKLLKKKDSTNKYNINFDFFYNRNRVILYNKFKVFKYMKFSYKHKIRFKRSYNSNKIEGISMFKSFLNNFIKLKEASKRYIRIRSRKRKKIERKKISKSFQPFFYFIFFFYLNKFNIIIDTYNKKLFSLFNLIKLEYYKGKIKKRNKKKKITYFFRIKSKKIRRIKNKKYKLLKKVIIKDIDQTRIAFLYFYWKYFILFLGLNLRNYNHKNNYNKIILYKKKWAVN